MSRSTRTVCRRLVKGPEQIFFEDAPQPEVRRRDVLVQVRATGITPTELTWDESYQNADGTPRIPGIPGHEFSGLVERMAADVTDFRIGDEVYGLADFPRNGAAAEFAAVRMINLALKTRSIPPNTTTTPSRTALNGDVATAATQR